jgi:hypothetical protein
VDESIGMRENCRALGGIDNDVANGTIIKATPLVYDSNIKLVFQTEYPLI